MFGSAFKIALIYAFFGCLWILVSDNILNFVAPSIEVANEWQTYKGWVYVIITAVFIYFMIISSQNRRKAQREELEEQRLRLTLLTENIRDVFWMVNPKTDEPVYVSPAYEKVWGRRIADLNDDLSDWTKAIIEEDRERVWDAARHHYKKGKAYSYSYRITDGNDELRWIYERGFPVYNDVGEFEWVVGISSDITHLKRVQNALQESEKRYKALFDGAAEIILIFEDQTIVECNEKAYLHMGVQESDILNRTLLHFSPEYQRNGEKSSKLLDTYFATVYRSEPVKFEWLCIRPDGTEFDIEVNMTKVALEDKVLAQAIIHDVTEKNILHELMVQSEKMMSVGSLAAGMGHELNNPLGIILQSVQVLEQRLDVKRKRNKLALESLDLNGGAVERYLDGGSVYKYLDYSRTAAKRAADIIKNMLSFSRMEESKRSLNAVEDLMEKAIAIARNDYHLMQKLDLNRLRIEKEYGDTIPVMCTETEITQAFLNIIKNAVKSLERTQDPALWIRTSMSEEGILVEIEDNGKGFDQKELRSIFEPFYESKNGVGDVDISLSVSYFIVTKHHNGKLYVRSAPGEGSVFSICLPVD